MYVLIKWIKENKVSVGLENYVRDKKMLGDPKRIGLVEHGAIGTKPPKGGWKTFPAQILCVNESLGEIRKAECQWIETHKLTPKDTIATDDDGFSDDGDESPQNHEVQDDSYWTPKRPKRDYKNEIKDLEERLKDKDKDIRRLRRLNLQLQEGLADTVTKAVKDAIQGARCTPSHPVPTSIIQEVPLKQTEEIKNKSVTELMNPIALDYTQKCENYKKLTRALMDSVFTVEQMSKCSVTGKKGLIGEQRPCLDKAKVRLVIDHVKKVYKGIGDSEVKVCMAQKLKDLRRRAEREPTGRDTEDLKNA